MRHLALIVAFGCGTACTDVPQPFDLDHARIMAVRIEPPSVEAGATARIDVLVTDSTALPRVAGPAELTVALPASAASLARYLAQTERGWELTAPDAATLAAIRATAGLAADAPILVPLDITVVTVDGPLAGSKIAALGARGANPPAPVILLDGVAGDFAMRPGTESILTIEQPDVDHSYRWFSSAGDLVGFTRAEARIEPADVDSGLVGVVARDQAGGTSWSLSPITVAR